MRKICNNRNYRFKWPYVLTWLNIYVETDTSPLL